MHAPPSTLTRRCARGGAGLPGALVAAALAAACSPAPPQPAAAPPAPPPDPASLAASLADTALLADARSELGALPAPEAQPQALTELGRRLFFETGASADGRVGCVTCHLPERWGADGRALSIGVFERQNARNAPTVFNAAGQNAQHWRGERESLEQQASRALLGPASFGNASDAEATRRLEQLPGAEAAFARAFPGEPRPVSIAHWGAAIAAYERGLVTPAPFDAWLGGDAAALSPEARRGLRVFLDSGCSECHDGPLLGGRRFARFGRNTDYWSLTHSAVIDNGRFDVTHDEDDRYAFKVAALRNVAETGPFFHDGSVAALPEAVTVMAKAQLGLDLGLAERDAIVAFLAALTGRVPSDFGPPPAAPASK